MPSSSLTRYMVNGAWVASCLPEQGRFSAALQNVETTQRRYLLELLRRNAGTRFGTKHRFSQISSVAEYQEHVPVTGYEGFLESIDAISRGEPNVLTAGAVKLFQPTSGSSSATKLIPWTCALGREFQRGIAPWIASLYRRKPALLHGTAYWSLSPPTTTQRTHGRLKVGFDHDAEYLGFVGRKLFSVVSAVSPAVAQCLDVAEFKKRTLASLLADENLSLISVWSPTFLTMLVHEFMARYDEILDAVMCGQCSPKRTGFLRSIAREGVESFFKQAWPRLQLVSCWTHGSSELYAAKLRRYFPDVEIQGKGLVATEAFVSLPFVQDHDPVLAVNSHFFEFQDPANERIALAHELVSGKSYRVIVTTGGGLYRYALGDLVRVTGFIGDAPCLRFVGREGSTSDLFGEKLTGVFVDQLVRRIFAEHGVMASFFMLAPVADAIGTTCYTLFLQTATSVNCQQLKSSLEKGLAENFHYAHCRKLGQLQEVRTFQIARSALSAEAVFQETMLTRGIKLGDIKMTVLDNQSGWERLFPGRFAE